MVLSIREKTATVAMRLLGSDHFRTFIMLVVVVIVITVVKSSIHLAKIHL